MSDKITWADIDAAHRKTYESISCSHCHQRLGRAEGIIRRLPEGVSPKVTYHRNPAGATLSFLRRQGAEAAGAHPPRSCPRYGRERLTESGSSRWPLYTRNRIN